MGKDYYQTNFNANLKLPIGETHVSKPCVLISKLRRKHVVKFLNFEENHVVKFLNFEKSRG